MDTNGTGQTFWPLEFAKEAHNTLLQTDIDLCESEVRRVQASGLEMQRI